MMQPTTTTTANRPSYILPCLGSLLTFWCAFHFVVIVPSGHPKPSTIPLVDNPPFATPHQVLSHDCCRPHSDLNGRFVGESDQYYRLIEQRLISRQPFAHVRWGDGEMRTAAGQDEYSQQLASSLLALASHPLASVNVGIWWLTDPVMKEHWNKIVPATNNEDYVFQEAFYLPAGEPTSHTYLKERQLQGWVPIKDKMGYKVVLVGPPHLKDLSFVQETHFVSSEDIEFNLTKTQDVIQQVEAIMEQHQDEPLLVLVSAGRSSKILVADLLSRPNNIHSFIDTGSSLDGYAGIGSRDYNDPRKLCQDPRNVPWIKPGVCESLPPLTQQEIQSRARQERRKQRQLERQTALLHRDVGR